MDKNRKKESGADKPGKIFCRTRGYNSWCKGNSLSGEEKGRFGISPETHHQKQYICSWRLCIYACPGTGAEISEKAWGDWASADAKYISEYS